MDDYFREELGNLLSAEQIDEVFSRVEDRIAIDRQLETLTLDRMHYHEALDRVMLIANSVEDNIAEHPVIRRHPELAELCDRASQTLFELYQAIGRRTDEPQGP